MKFFDAIIQAIVRHINFDSKYILRVQYKISCGCIVKLYFVLLIF